MTVRKSGHIISMNFNDGIDNADHFRDCLSASVIEKLNQTPTKALKKRRSKQRKNSIKGSPESVLISESGNDPNELSEFIEVAMPVSPAL